MDQCYVVYLSISFQARYGWLQLLGDCGAFKRVTLGIIRSMTHYFVLKLKSYKILGYFAKGLL